MTYLAVNLLFRYNTKLGIGGVRLCNYHRGNRIPSFNFETYEIEQMYAYDFIKKLEDLNDGISLDDLFFLIDISASFTTDDLDALKHYTDSHTK